MIYLTWYMTKKQKLKSLKEILLKTFLKTQLTVLKINYTLPLKQALTLY